MTHLIEMEFPRFLPGQQVRVFMGSGWRAGRVIRPPDAKHRLVAVKLPDRISPVVVYDPRNITNA